MTDFSGTKNNDIFNGGIDNDNAYGAGGHDRLSGGDGFDLLAGDSGADTLNGGAGDDVLYAASESPPFGWPYFSPDNPYTPPLLDTGAEVDRLTGGSGADKLFAGYGDFVDGGTNGVYGDYLFISFLGAPRGVTADFRLASQTIGGGTITNVENISWVQGSRFADNINVQSNGSTGYGDFTVVHGMGGNDRLVAGYYTGTLDGGTGDDFVDGRASQYLNMVIGGDGNDTLYTNSNTFASAFGGAGNDKIYSHGETYGGSGNDLIVIAFSYYPGRVYGEAGNDEIRASSTGTFMIGGTGADTLIGSDGSDTLFSADLADAATQVPANDMGLERDKISAGGGEDTIAAGYGDNVDGGTGNDTLRLSLGGATSGVALVTSSITAGTPFVLGGGTIKNVETLLYLRGSNFADALSLSTQAQLLTVFAGGGDDVITSFNSSVDVDGGDGDDRFVTGNAGDILDGGNGNDTVDYSKATAGVTVTLALAAGATGSGAGGDKLSNIENIDGSKFADKLNGSNEANVLRGMAGADRLDGKGGNDILVGGSGDDVYVVGDAGDTASEKAGEGLDTVLSSVDFTLGANVERLTLTGKASKATGNDLANVLIGNASHNTLNGGAGVDRMEGGKGDDAYIVDNWADVIVELSGQGRDTVRSSANYVLSAEVEDLVLTGGAHLKATGNGLANALTGNAGNNILDGRGGADTMIGGKGHDRYIVDNVGDKVIESGSSGNDVIESSVSYTIPVHVEQLILTGTWSRDGIGTYGDNRMTGNSGHNLLNGLRGDDRIDGGAGNDMLYGSEGDDVLIGGAGKDKFLFNKLPGSGELRAGVDDILDFSVADDIIYLANYAFTRLGPKGALNPNAFRKGTNAGDASDRIVYDQASGNIFYDADGTGAAAKILFATVDAGTPLTSADFHVYG